MCEPMSEPVQVSPSRDQPVAGGPICKRCGVENAPGSDRCWTCGSALAGNRLAWKHGAFGRADRPELADVRAAAESWTEDVRASQGGPELAPIRAGAVDSLGGLEYLRRLLIDDLKHNGLHTKSKKGGPPRVRSSFPLLLQVLDRWTPYALMLGRDARQRKVIQSPREWLESLDQNDEPRHDDESTVEPQGA